MTVFESFVVVGILKLKINFVFGKNILRAI
jgi:hypothetical protein